MGLNLTGTPNTRDYNLGRGIVYLAELDLLDAHKEYRDLGNAPAFAISVDVQELLHQSSRRGLKVTDKRVVISQTINLSFSLDEINHQNLAMFFQASLATPVNPAVAGVGLVGAQITITDDAVLGSWYDLKTAAGLRVSFLDSTGVVITQSTTPTVLVEGTDYDLDLKMGRVFIKSTTVAVTAGDSLTWYSAAQAGAKAVLHQVQGLKGQSLNYALKFIANNPANNDEPIEFEFHSVSISPDGDLPLIGDTWTEAKFKGAAQLNGALDATLTITALPA